MIDRSDKSLQESESDREMNEKSGPTMFCISPPPRRFTKRNTERSKVLPENTKKEISLNTDLKSENTANEYRQEKTAHEESKQLKNVAFCVSPPARKPAKMDTQHIIKKLRNGRMNAVTNTGRQPLKAVHATGIHLMDSHRYTVNSSPKQENEKHTNHGANDIESEDKFTTVERKENQKESMLRILKMCAENQRNIRKLRDEVTEAKTNIWKGCEEEEQWNCPSNMHKNRVNASLTKINNLQMEKPHLFSKPGEREVTIDELREDLIKCRMDLIFHLSQTKDVMNEAIKEKTMERRRLGVTCPMWFLSDFQGEYLKYRKTHGFRRASLSVTRPVCPAVDIAVSVQKSTYNIKQNFKILIDGRQFSYRDLGLTQVMATVHEERFLQGEFRPVIPQTLLSETESRILFRKPQTTSTIDVDDISSNGCSKLLMSLVDERLSIASNISLCPRIDTGNDTEIFLKEEDTFTSNHQDTQLLHPHYLMVQKLPDESLLEKKRSIRHLPPLRNSPPPVDNQNTIDVCEFWENTEKVKSHFAKGTRTELQEIPASIVTFGRSESEESVVTHQRKKNPKGFNTQVQIEIQKYERDNGLIYGDVENFKHDNFRTAKESDYQMMQQQLPPLVTNDHLPKRKVWQSKHQILPEIRRSNEKPLTTERDIKRQINMSPKDGSYFILCDPKMVPVKILHRDKRSNKVTYLTTLVNKEMIPPVSVARKGSSIPVRMKYLKGKLNNTQFGGPTKHTGSLPTVLSQNYLHTINEASNEFDEEFSETDETRTKPEFAPFYQNNLARSNSALGFNQQKETKSLLQEDATSNLHVTQKPSRIPVPCRGAKTVKTAENAAQKTSRIPVPCLGAKRAENAAQKPSHIPVPCLGTKRAEIAGQKPSRIPVACRETKRAEIAGQKPSRIPVACRRNKTEENAGQKPSRIPVPCRGTKLIDQKTRIAAENPNRIPVLLRAKRDSVEKELLDISRTCKDKDSWNFYNYDYQDASSSNISFNVNLPSGRLIFVPHPPPDTEKTNPVTCN